MAQYDVFINPSSSAASGIPYVVVIQSDQLDALSTRLTMPLAAMEFTGKVPTALCPVITVNAYMLWRTTQRHCQPNCCGVQSTTYRHRQVP